MRVAAPPAHYAGDLPLARLFPDRAELRTEDAVAALRLGEGARADRPYMVLNMISSLDGKAVLEGRTGGLGNEVDRALFHGLRTQVDAVLVGAGTVRTERYGPMVRGPALRERREAEGLAPRPLACVVSGRLDLPPDLPLLQDPDSRVIVMTSSGGRLGPCPAEVEYIRGSGAQLTLGPAMARLRAEYGVRSLLCEGGPTLNAGLLREGLVNELFLSVSPKLIGGREALTIVAGEPLPDPLELELIWLLEADGHLFGRYRLPA